MLARLFMNPIPRGHLTKTKTMETLVQGTNDSSIVSKLSMVQKCYFNDDFIQYFVQKPSRRAPLMNIGYYVRSIIIHNSIKYYLDLGFKQVLSLGAGFDTTYFRLSANYDVKHFEVDLEDVVKNKINSIKFCDKMINMITNVNVCSEGTWLNSSEYAIFAQDLSDVNTLEKRLIEFGIDFGEPTIIFSECAITYMEEKSSTDLLRWTSQKFKKSVFLNYEQINPMDGFGQIMKKHFIKIQSPLKSLDTYKTPFEQEKRFLINGWETSTSIQAMEIFDQIVSKKEQIFKLEPFDEWEEWHLKCTHYTLSISSIGKYDLPQFFTKKTTKETLQNMNIDLMEEVEINRFGHCSFMYEKQIFILGGFGCMLNRHGRIKQILKIDMESKTTHNIEIETTAILDVLYATCTQLNNQFILYGGRTSPLKSVNENPYLITFKNGLKINEIIIKNCKPKPRYRHTCSNIQDYLIIYGGRTTDLQILGDCWKLKTDKNEGFWEEIHSEIKPCERFSHSTVSKNNIMYLSGGLNKEFDPLGDIWKLNNTSWEKIDVEITPRYGHTMHTSSNYIIFVGGVSKNITQPICTLLNLDTLVVQNFIFSFQDIFMFHNHTSENYENDIYVLGGGGNCFSFGTHLNAQPLKININKLVQKVT